MSVLSRSMVRVRSSISLVEHDSKHIILHTILQFHNNDTIPGC